VGSATINASTGSIDFATEQTALLRAFLQLWRSVVAHLARLSGRRAELAQDMRLLNRLKS